MASQANFTGKQLITRTTAFEAPGDRGEFHHFDAFMTLDASLFLMASAQAKFSLSISNLFNRIGQEYHGIVIPSSINDPLGRRFSASFSASL